MAYTKPIWPVNLFQHIWKWSDEYFANTKQPMPDFSQTQVDGQSLQVYLNTLQPREQDILLQHYKCQRTLNTIAKAYSLSEARISQIEHLALRKLAKQNILQNSL